MATLIKGGRIITAADDYVGDILIENGVISLIGESLPDPAATVIDARGKYVLPGGIDPHTHLDMPFAGTVTCDDFEAGTVAAAFGGTTTVIDFCMQPAGTRFLDALAIWHAKRESKAVVDVGFHLAITDLEGGGSTEELRRLPQAGVTSFKLFMAYKGTLMVDDATLFETMRVAAETHSLVMVHAEQGHVIDILVAEAIAAGNTSPQHHGLTRPPEAEGEATNRAIQIAHMAGCDLYVVHVSCRESLDPIREARSKGWNVWGETCPQYLLLDDTYLTLPDFEGAKYVFSPPPRAKENQPILWAGLAQGDLAAVSTDHCAFTWETQKRLGIDDFSKIPNGAPGVENRLHTLHHFGVRGGHISLNRMVELLSTNPAKMFGLYPRKGTVCAGSDADIVIFDPEKEHTISASTHHSNADYNPYEGTTVVGSPQTVLVRGAIVVDDGELKVAPGYGEFIHRAGSNEPLANRVAAPRH